MEYKQPEKSIPISKKEESPRQPSSSADHTRLLNACLMIVARQFRTTCSMWRNETGMALNIRTDQKFKYGLVGSPDMIGVARGGVFVGAEIKTGNARQSQDQKNFENMVKRFGGHYAVIRSEEEFINFIEGIVK